MVCKTNARFLTIESTISRKYNNWQFKEQKATASYNEMHQWVKQMKMLEMQNPRKVKAKSHLQITTCCYCYAIGQTSNKMLHSNIHFHN